MQTIAIVLLVAAATMRATETTRILNTEFEVNAPIAKAWAAWTTPEGVKTFFAPGCNVEARVDGPYDILFAPDARPGKRGAEGLRVPSHSPA